MYRRQFLQSAAAACTVPMLPLSQDKDMIYDKNLKIWVPEKVDILARILADGCFHKLFKRHLLSGSDIFLVYDWRQLCTNLTVISAAPTWLPRKAGQDRFFWTATIKLDSRLAKRYLSTDEPVHACINVLKKRVSEIPNVERLMVDRVHYYMNRYRDGKEYLMIEQDHDKQIDRFWELSNGV